VTTRILTGNLQDPDEVGQAEYRLLYGFLRDLEDSMETESPEEIRRHALVVLDEIKEWADVVALTIRSRSQ